MLSLRFAVVGSLLLFATGCGSSPPLPPTTAAGAATGVGHVDPAFAAAAASYQGAYKIKLYFDAKGVMYKASLYHHDDAKVPEVVRKLAAERMPGSTVTAYEFELYADAGPVHEVEVKTADGRECEVSATPAGVFRYTECQVPPANLLPAIAKLVADNAPGGQVVEVEERKDASGAVEIRVESKVGEVIHYLRFRPSGELLSRALRYASEVEVGR